MEQEGRSRMVKMSLVLVGLREKEQEGRSRMVKMSLGLVGLRAWSR